jgi:hypothetical protein
MKVTTKYKNKVQEHLSVAHAKNFVYLRKFHYNEEWEIFQENNDTKSSKPNKPKVLSNKGVRKESETSHPTEGELEDKLL